MRPGLTITSYSLCHSDTTYGCFCVCYFSVSSGAKLIPGLSAGLGRLVNSQRVGSRSRVDCTSESSKRKGENLKKLPIALLDVIGSFCTIL